MEKAGNVYRFLGLCLFLFVVFFCFHLFYVHFNYPFILFICSLLCFDWHFPCLNFYFTATYWYSGVFHPQSFHKQFHSFTVFRLHDSGHYHSQRVIYRRFVTPEASHSNAKGIHPRPYKAPWVLTILQYSRGSSCPFQHKHMINQQ